MANILPVGTLVLLELCHVKLSVREDALLQLLLRRPLVYPNVHHRTDVDLRVFLCIPLLQVSLGRCVEEEGMLHARFEKPSPD